MGVRGGGWWKRKRLVARGGGWWEEEEAGGKERKESFLLGLCVILTDAHQLFEEPEVTDPEKIEVC